MPYVWIWLQIAQLHLLLPNRWKVSFHCREGSTLSAHANARVRCIFRSSRVFFRPFEFYTVLFLRQIFTPAFVNDSITEPRNGCDTALCKPKADQYSRLPYVAARTLRAQCVATAAVSVSDFSQFLPPWAGRGFRDKNASITARGSRVSISPPNSGRSSLRPPATWNFCAPASAFVPALKKI